jgi:formylglycine-generating enzyme required for sulfatase activity
LYKFPVRRPPDYHALMREGTLATPEQQSAYDVFVSYSHEDEQWVQKELLPRLNSAGLKVCIDSESYQPGEPFEAGTPVIRAIEKAILVSHKTICVFSHTYRESEWCELEDILISSLDPSGRDKRLLPILLKPCELPQRIKARLYVDFTPLGAHDQAWGRLLAALGGLTVTMGKVEEKPSAMPRAEAMPLVEAQAQLERPQAEERERREEEARQAKRQEEVATLYAEAQSHLQAGRWSEAITGFQAVLDLVPTHGVADRQLAQAQAQLERQQAEERERHEEEARQAERQEKVATLYAEAQSHLQARHWSEAIRGFQAVLDLVPTHGVAARQLAQAQAQLERQQAEERERREEEARQAERQEKAATLYAEAQSHLQAGRWSEAITGFQAVLELVPTHAEAAQQLAGAQAQLERQQAEERKRREEQARQTELARLYAIADEADQARDWSAAIESFEAVLSLDPGYRDAAARLVETRKARTAAEVAPQRRTDFSQVEAEFQKLKAQYEAGTLTEAEFKAQLEKLMLQDEQGRWWMIGYETCRWYYHDGKTWVRGEPPQVAAQAQARARAEKQETRRQAQTPAAGASAPQAGATKTLETVGITLVYVPAGEFLMGSADKGFLRSLISSDRSEEKPQHRVYLDGYWIGRTEVTNAQYDEFVEAGGYREREYWTDEGWQWKESNGITWRAEPQEMIIRPPHYYDNDDFPVTGVSWYEAAAFAKWAGARLPTEAEWENAARGGANGHGYIYAGSDNVDEVAWYNKKTGVELSWVGGKKPNELGLYDMSGNVAEWCADWYSDEYYSQSPERNPTGPDTGESRVVRGGSWLDYQDDARCAARSRSEPDARDGYLGFRVAA